MRKQRCKHIPVVICGRCMLDALFLRIEVPQAQDQKKRRKAAWLGAGRPCGAPTRSAKKPPKSYGGSFAKFERQARRARRPGTLLLRK